MKNFIVVLLVLITSVGFAQKPLYDYTIEELEKAKTDAVAAENYADAAKYKKAIALKQELTDAVAAEDYDKAAAIKAQINNLNSNNSGDNNAANKSASTSSGNAPAMEFVNQVYQWNKASNTVTNLEKDKPEIKTKSYAGWGYAESKSFWVIEGATSNVKIGGDEAEFILKITPGMDPSDMFRLIKFDVIEGKRHLPSFQTTAGAWVGGTTKERKDKDVPVSFVKIEDGVYHVEIKRNLSKGEYAFYGMNKMFSFTLTGSAKSNATESNTTDFGAPEFTAADIYTSDLAYWFGADFSLFKLSDPKLIGQEGNFEKYIAAWQRVYVEEVPVRKLQAWFGKAHLEDYRHNGQSMHLQALEPNWIVGQAHFIDEDLIQEHLKNYSGFGSGLGIVFMVENLNKLTKKMSGYFVWFDMSSRQILRAEKVEGRPSKGGMSSYWGKSFIPATKYYIDEIFRKEKAMYR